MTDLPTRVPIGLCLPKECNQTEIFADYLHDFNNMVNHQVDSLKTDHRIDFDRLWESKFVQRRLYPYSGDQDIVMVKNIMQILSNHTHFNFQARIMEEQEMK